MKACISIPAAILGVFCAGNATFAAEAKVEEQVVGPVAELYNNVAPYVVSSKGGRLATVTRKGSRAVVIVDGVEGPKFDEIVPPTAAYVDPRPVFEAQRAASLAGRTPPDVQSRPVLFSRDGKRFAYVGRQGQEWVLVVDGKESLRIPAEGIVSAATIAGPSGTVNLLLEFTGDDGKHLMFARSVYGGYQLWVDGQKMPGIYVSGGGGTEGTVDPIISRDGARFAYVAQIDREKRTVIVDGKDAGYVGDNLQFTADGQHVFSFVRQGAVVGLAVDGKLKMKTDGISQLVMTPVGNGFAAVLQRLNPTGQFLVVNGKRIEGTDCENIPKVVFSPDGKHFAAVCKNANNVWFVVVDGEKGQQYDNIWQPETLAFSPDSSKVGYVAQSGGKFFVVINKDESDAFQSNAKFAFSPDGKRVAYGGMQNTRSPQPPGAIVQSWPVYIDGKAERLSRGMGLDSVAFSPDSSRYAYGTGPIFLDGKDTGLAGNFTFSPDSKHITVVGFRSADNKRGVFVDGQFVYEGPNVRYRAFTPDGQHVFWMAFEAAKSGAPGAYEHVTYLDGKPVARCDRIDSGTVAWIYPGGNYQFVEPPPAWAAGPDGVLTFFGPVGNEMKRFRITPSPDTSLATMIADAVTKAKAEPQATAVKNKNQPDPTSARRLKQLNIQRAKQGLPPLKELPE